MNHGTLWHVFALLIIFCSRRVVLLDQNESCQNHEQVFLSFENTTEEIWLRGNGTNSKAFQCTFHLSEISSAVLTMVHLDTASNRSIPVNFSDCMNRKEKIVIQQPLNEEQICISGARNTYCKQWNDCQPIGKGPQNVFNLANSSLIRMNLVDENSNFNLNLIPSCSRLSVSFESDPFCAKSQRLLSCSYGLNDDDEEENNYWIESDFFCNLVPNCPHHHTQSEGFYLDESFCLPFSFFIIALVTSLVFFIIALSLGSCCYLRHSNLSRRSALAKLMMGFIVFAGIFYGVAFSTNPIPQETITIWNYNQGLTAFSFMGLAVALSVLFLVFGAMLLTTIERCSFGPKRSSSADPSYRQFPPVVPPVPERNTAEESLPEPQRLIPNPPFNPNFPNFERGRGNIPLEYNDDVPSYSSIVKVDEKSNSMEKKEKSECEEDPLPPTYNEALNLR